MARVHICWNSFSSPEDALVQPVLWCKQLADNRRRDVAVNRRAFHDYFVEDELEAGIVLTGTEVKSLRAGRCNIGDGFVRVVDQEARLENVHISPYERGGYVNHDPLRSRRLLLHRDQISRLIGQVKQKGYTLIPLRIYFHNNWAKVLVGLCRGKRQYDKRQSIAATDAKRQMERALKSFGRSGA